jgi:hypothetical protein
MDGCMHFTYLYSLHLRWSLRWSFHAVHSHTLHSMCVKQIRDPPDVVHFAVCFAVPNEARPHLVKHQTAVGALQAGCVPFEIWSDAQNELIEYGTSASGARALASNGRLQFCTQKRTANT